MSSGEFSMDTRAIDEVANNVVTQATEYLKLVDETTAIIDKLSSHWEGTTYQNLKDGYYARLQSLEDLNKSLKDFANELSEKAENARKTASAVVSILGK